MKSPQPDLFAESLPNAQTLRALPPDEALKIRAARLSPAQQRFNKLLARIETLKQRMDSTRAAADAHGPKRSATLRPLERQQQDLTRRMALHLHERLQRRASLTVAQRRTAADILCSLCLTLAHAGDLEMQALHDQYSPHSLEAMQKQDAQELRAAYEDALGVPLPDDMDPNNPESLLRAMEKLRHEAQARDDARRAKQQARKAAKPKSARQKQAEQTREDAHSALRTVFRQLASALHPDRETDPAERARKTELMSRVNAAYQRRDLTELLQLQLHLAHADPEAIAELADDKVNALARLLQEQSQALEHDLRVLEQQVLHEFNLPPYASVTPTLLAAYLAQAQKALEQELMRMAQDLERIQVEVEFKRWLKEQKQASQQQDMADELDRLLSGFAWRR